MRRRPPTTSMEASPGLLKHLRRVRIGIIRAEYNAEITQSLEAKCLQGLQEAGLSRRQINCYSVPGCFEIPIFAQKVAARKKYDLLIALGAVIRGDTLHFELVANECARGVMEVSLKFNIPIVFEVLATHSHRDAARRAGNNRLNKGFEAARAAVTMLAALEGIRG
ncbi:MAG TPA: 6,7-dimethyl-8-ribityllumazine synthase [Terriglobia bacterium]|nr:6,7-dimethyl-8-ribityllumazine synthase [Terriglobia bacterium]